MRELARDPPATPGRAGLPDEYKGGLFRICGFSCRLGIPAFGGPRCGVFN
jgi:hypothetical protein